ncbi:MAG: GrpB family protein [Planctomycetes bacterium]|nr:GrpB family protein [Planctomycetota bacterium]
MAAAAVVLVPYDPDWPRRFERERDLLARIFRGTAVAIEHVGSTAVPGLGGKPVLDIMAGVPQLSDVEARIPDLEVAGYEYVAEYESRLPERRYFRKPRAGPRTHHLHAVVRDGVFWRRHLLFRDYLRTHPEAASAYFELKERLASRYRTDRVAYTDGKSAFVESVLARAAADEGA